MRSDAGWPRVCIADVCEAIVDCVNRTAPIVERRTPYKMIRTTNVRSGWIDLSDTKYVTEETYKRWTRRQVPKRGDIVLTREAPLGEVGMIRTDESVFLGQRLVSYRADPQKLDSRFLLYSFQEQHLQAQIKALGSGATVEHMRVPDAKKLTLVLPPLDVQQQIGSILSAYDDLIENNTRRIAILEEMARALYQEWFVHFRFPGHERVPLVDSPVGPIPDGWEVVPLGEIARVEGESFNPGQSPSEVFAHFSFPAFDADQMPVLEQGSEILSNKLSFKVPCVLLAKLNPRIPRIWPVVAAPDAKPICSTEFLPLVAGEPFSAALLAAFCSTSEFIGRLRSLALGTSTSHQRVKPRDLQAMPAVVASQGLLARADQLIGPAYALAENLRHKTQNLRTTRDLLLPKLISGEIDVSALPTEPIAEAAD
jgi:type I restriction enzyme, S subunit